MSTISLGRVHVLHQQIAIEYGVEEAIFLNSMQFWLQTNLSNDDYIHDGNVWVSHSVKALTKIFPFWKKNQIERIINSLIQNGILIKENHNQNPWNRRNWYAFTQKGREIFGINVDEKLNKNEGNEAPPTLPENEKCTLPENEKCTLPENEKCYIEVDIPLDNLLNKRPCAEKPDAQTKQQERALAEKSFQEFWNLYPSKKAQKQSHEEWFKNKLFRKSQEILKKLKKQIALDDHWKAGYIPNALTYLRGERWLDGITKVKKNDNLNFHSELAIESV